MSVIVGPAWWQIALLVTAAAFMTGALVHYFDVRTDDPNSADVGFLDDMTKHHQQAISMAFSYFHNGIAPQLPSTASEIIQGQAGDLRVMRMMRAKWANIEGSTDGTVMGWMGHPMPLEQMPGFARNADTAKLDTLKGSGLDDLFTTLMIRHHFGGIEMANAAKAKAATHEVRDFAEGIVILQSKEINELNQWRASAGLPIISGLK